MDQVMLEELRQRCYDSDPERWKHYLKGSLLPIFANKEFYGRLPVGTTITEDLRYKIIGSRVLQVALISSDNPAMFLQKAEKVISEYGESLLGKEILEKMNEDL